MNKFSNLKKEVWLANIALKDSGLVILTWGNVSAIDRKNQVFAIKPSGVPYEEMTAEDIVVLDLEGRVVDGKKKPSVDWPTHLELYRSFCTIQSVVHTHSLHATAFAQAGKPLPCLGTTHADHFYGSVPVTRYLRPGEMFEYEKNTGKVIIERFRLSKLNPHQMSGCLVRGHGPFVWGDSPKTAVLNSIVLEEISKMNILTSAAGENLHSLPKHLLDTHYLRKHGNNSYYGQKGDKK